MELQEIIKTYVEKKAHTSEDATSFILEQFQEDNDDAKTLRNKYVGLFIVDDKEGTLAYDPITACFYEIDPEYKAQTFEPNDNEYVLFKKKGIRVESKLTLEGKLNFVQKLQVVGSEEVLDAHIYGRKDVENELFALYGTLVSKANEKKWAANKKIRSLK